MSLSLVARSDRRTCSANPRPNVVDGIGDDLLRASLRRGHARARVAAVVAVALDFGSWRRLTAVGGLAGDSAAALMAQLIRAAGK